MVFLLILLSHTYPDAVKVWTHCYMYTLYRSPADHRCDQCVQNVCSWIAYDNQLYIWCYYLHLVLRWFNIAKSFYFNFGEVFFNLYQERKLYAINCVLFFAKAFISSLNSEWLLRQFELYITSIIVPVFKPGDKTTEF